MAQEQKNMNVNFGCGGGGLGMLCAVICSWTLNHSVPWAIFHAFCSWLYVAYYVVTHVVK